MMARRRVFGLVVRIWWVLSPAVWRLPLTPSCCIGASPLHGSVAWGVAGESVDDVGVSANPIDGLVADVPHPHQESARAQDAFDLSESGVVLEPVKRLGGNHGVD